MKRREAHARTPRRRRCGNDFGMEESLLDDLKLRMCRWCFVDVGPPRPRGSNIRIEYIHGIRQRCSNIVALRTNGLR